MGFTLKSGNNPTMKVGVLGGRSSSPLTKTSPLTAQTNEERWSEGSSTAEGRTTKTLNELVALRKDLKKGSPEYNAIQNEINIALGDSTRHEQQKRPKIKAGDETIKIKKTGEGDDTKVTVKGDEGKTKVKTEGDESTDPKTRGTVKSTIKKVGSKIKGGIQKLKDKRAAKKVALEGENPEDLSEAQVKGRTAEAEYDKQQEKQNKKNA